MSDSLQKFTGKSLLPKNEKGWIMHKNASSSVTILLLISSKDGILGYQMTEGTICRWIWLHHLCSFIDSKVVEEPDYLQNDLWLWFDNSPVHSMRQGMIVCERWSLNVILGPKYSPVIIDV